MLDRTTEIVPRATVESIVAQRNRALALYGVAHDKLLVAADAVGAATEASLRIFPRKSSFNHDDDRENERRHLLNGVTVPDRPDYLETVRRVIDSGVWGYIIDMTDLEMLMDKQAKDEFRQQLRDNPPEVTVDNVYATLEQKRLDAKTIFQRGIANVFSNLDRRFRSHDGWKIGGRVILSYAFNEYGSWNYHRHHEDTFRDIERTFLVLDGKRMTAAHASIVAVVTANRGRYGPQQTFVENEYFRIRCWKNGNAHIWFKRDDLLETVNKMLAEYYGEVIPEDREPDEDTGLHTPKTSLAKNYGFFPSTEPVAKRVIDLAPLHHGDDEPPITVLEPSAGTGNIARLAAAKGAIVDCIEIQPKLSMELRTSGLFRKVACGDFLKQQPKDLYDVVAMNPPFDLERDIDHVLHSLKFLKPDGCLVAVMSAGTEFRETKKSKAFRALMQEMNAHWEDLPAGSFSSVGTNVNTIILKVYKHGRPFWR